MAATYFLGARNFTGKSGKTFFTVNLLSKNRFGDWQTGRSTKQGLQPIYISAELFKAIHESGFKVGDPVILDTDLNGDLLGLEHDPEYPVLELWE